MQKILSLTLRAKLKKAMGKKLFISNSKESVRMFDNQFLEMMSKTHWTVPIVVFLPIITILVYLGFNYGINILSTFILFILGLFIWSITEYSLHRFVFHYEPKSKLGQRLHWLMHGVHHDYPQDRLRLVIPPGLSLLIATVFFLLFSLVIPMPEIFPFFAGFLFAYLVYDTSHYFFHHFAFQNKLFLKLKKHHMKHHYQENGRGYGVSSNFWDILFGTNFKDSNTNKTEEL